MTRDEIIKTIGEMFTRLDKWDYFWNDPDLVTDWSCNVCCCPAKEADHFHWCPLGKLLTLVEDNVTFVDDTREWSEYRK